MSRLTSKSVVASKSVVVAETAAQIESAAPIVAAAPVSLANATSADQTAAIIAALSIPSLSVVAAAIAMHKGSAIAAATELADKNLPALHIVARIVPILRNAAPTGLFTDGNNRGARVGELFASRLGLSALYRDASRASLKDARAALVESAK